MSRLPDRWWTWDVPIDHPITPRLLLTWLAVLAVPAPCIIPRVRNSQAFRAERERGRALLYRLKVERPPGVNADGWEHRWTWVWNATGAAFFDPFDQAGLHGLHHLNNRFEQELTKPVTVVTPYRFWALIGESCGRGRHYTTKFGGDFWTGDDSSQAIGALCGSTGQVVLQYGHLQPVVDH